MDAATLRSAQRPLKEPYREEPAAALLTLERSGTVGEWEYVLLVAAETA